MTLREGDMVRFRVGGERRQGVISFISKCLTPRVFVVSYKSSNSRLESKYFSDGSDLTLSFKPIRLN